MNWKNELGKKAEDLALQHLLSQGFHLLKRNFRNRLGEIDLVVGRGDCLVFVEVKALTQHAHFRAEDHFDYRKMKKQVQLAKSFLQKYGSDDFVIRFDLIAVTKDKASFRIEQYENVINDCW